MSRCVCVCVRACMVVRVHSKANKVVRVHSKANNQTHATETPATSRQ